MKQNITNNAFSFFGLLIVLTLIFGSTVGFARAANLDERDDEQTIGTAKISETEARRLANEAYTGTGQFTDVELEMENGNLVYAVEYTESDGNEVDIKIDADTGAIVSIESDKTEDVNDDEGDSEDEDSTMSEDDESEDEATTTDDASSSTAKTLRSEAGNDDASTATMQTIINLLNQLLALLRSSNI